MYATPARPLSTTVELIERQFARVRTTGSANNTIVVNLAPATAEAAGFRSGGDVVAESVVYDTDAADGWLVGYGTAEKVDGRSYSNAARVLPGGGESTTTVVGIPKAAFEETLGVTLAELQDGADVRLAVATGPGVVAFRRSQAVEVDVDSETFADLDAQLLLEDEQ